MARPPQDPQIRINEILDAAETLFYERGYQPTMISDIVKKIGVAQGTFYYYFSSKEEIVDALIKRHLAKFKAAIEAAVNSADASLPRKIELITNIVLSSIKVKQGLLLEFLYNDRHLHLMDKVFRQTKKLLAPYLLSVIKEGANKHVFSVSHPKAVADTIISIIQCHVEAIYERETADFLEQKKAITRRLVENVLGLSEGKMELRG